MTQHIITVTITVNNPIKLPDLDLLDEFLVDCITSETLGLDLRDEGSDYTTKIILNDPTAIRLANQEETITKLQAENASLKHIMDMVAIDMVNEDLSPTQLDTLAEQLTTAAARIRA